MTTKRYALFAYPAYYPGGGMDDLCGFFETEDDALAEASHHDYFEIVDTTTFQVVAHGRNGERNPEPWKSLFVRLD